MFCPNCRSEYREGFYTCSDCHIDLVSELPEIKKTEIKTDYVEHSLLITTSSPVDILLIKSVLEAENIKYHVLGENFSLTSETLPIKVLVENDRYEEAKNLMKSMDLKFTLF